MVRPWEIIVDLYATWKLALRLYHILGFTRGIRVYGKEHIQSGAKIIIANHPNASDYFILPLVFPDKICYFMEPYLLQWPIVGWVHAACMHIPVEKGQREKILNAAQERIVQGSPIIIFPEGSLSPEGGYDRPGVGAALLSLKTETPIVPAGIYVPQQFRHPLKIRFEGETRVGIWQFFGPCFVKIGEPWYPPSPEEIDKSEPAMRQLSEMLMGKVIELVEEVKEIARQEFE